MNPITVHQSAFLLPPDTREIVYAKDQPEYLPLPSLRTADGRVVTQWQPSDQELEALLNGQPITLVLHTFDQRCRICGNHQGLTPVQIGVGGMDLR